MWGGEDGEDNLGMDGGRWGKGGSEGAKKKKESINEEMHLVQDNNALLYASKGSTFSDGSCHAQMVESRLPLKHMSPVLDMAMLRTPCLVGRRKSKHRPVVRQTSLRTCVLA